MDATAPFHKKELYELLTRFGRGVALGTHVKYVAGEWDPTAVDANGLPGDWVPGTSMILSPTGVALLEAPDSDAIKALLGDVTHQLMARIDELETAVVGHVADAAAKDGNMQTLLAEVQAARDAAAVATAAQAETSARADALAVELADARAQFAAVEPAIVEAPAPETEPAPESEAPPVKPPAEPEAPTP